MRKGFCSRRTLKGEALGCDSVRPGRPVRPRTVFKNSRSEERLRGQTGRAEAGRGVRGLAGRARPSVPGLASGAATAAAFGVLGRQ